MSSIWITGARGFIGRNLARVVAANGWEVYGIGHGPWAEIDYRAIGLRGWLNGDVSSANLDAAASLFGRPSAVVHLAGGSAVGPSFVAPCEDFHRTVSSAVELADWLRSRAPQAKLVLVSSAAVYGAGHSRPIKEIARCRPYSPYGFHKQMAELICESYAINFGLSVTIVRLFSVYGRGLMKQLLWDLCVRLKSGGPLLLNGTGEEQRDLIHVDDAALLVSTAISMESKNCRVINGGTGIAVSVREIAQHVSICWGGTRDLAFSGAGRPGDPKYLVACTDELRKLGFSPACDWRSGVADYVEWAKNRGASKSV